MSATFAPKTGFNMAMYRNSGTHSTPTWNLVSEVGDVSISDLSRVLAQLKRRANGFTKNLPAMIDSIAIEFRLHFGLGATQYTAIRTAFFAGTVEEWAIMNGIIGTNSHQGLTLPVIVEQFPWDQPLENVSGHDVRLAAAYAENDVTGGEVDPYWYIVGTTTTTTTS